MTRAKVVNKEIILQTAYTKEVNNMVKLTPIKRQTFEAELRVYARNFLKKNFNMKLGIPIKIDGRLTKAGGSFHYYRRKDHNEAKVIKISQRYIACALHDEVDGIPAILDVLKHELVHYALLELGMNHADGQDDFENKLAELDIGSSGATPKNKRLSKTPNVWYKMVDVYQNDIFEQKYEYNHTAKAQDWVGRRVSSKILKVVF